MIDRIRKLAQFCVGLLPASRTKNALLRTLGYRIDDNCRMGISLLINVKSLELASDVRIGNFNALRNLELLKVGTAGSVGSWNWISASSEYGHCSATPHSGALRIGQQSAITSRHYIDCSGGVGIGEFSTVAGQRSTILSHGIDFEKNIQTLRPVFIGKYAFISTGCIIVGGASIGDACVVAAGGVVSGTIQHPEGPSLWGGVPARFIKELSGKHFVRASGYVKTEIGLD